MKTRSILKIRIIVIFAAAFYLVIINQANAQAPAIKWWFNTHDASYGQTTAGDIDNDGRLELVFGCYRNDSCIYALNAEDGTLLWKYNAHAPGAEGCNDAAPVIFDVDNDGTPEVIVPGSCNPKTFCFNGPDGTLKWQANTRGSDSPPTIADIDNDGKPEILHGEFGGYVICINAENGAVKWEIPVNMNSWIQTAPTIVDLDNDGQLDFVVASWAFSGDTNYVYTYQGNDHSLRWKHKVDDVTYHGTAVADLDHDSLPELVIGDYSGKLFVLNGEDGSENWTYTYNAGYYIGAPAAIADLDDDNNCEVVFCSWFKIIALRHDGTPFWDYSIPGYATAFRGVVLSDVDDDHKPDVVFGTSNGLVIALKGSSGIPLWTRDLADHYGDTLDFDHAPVIADFDDDDSLDLFIVGGHAKYPNFQDNYGRGYALSIGPGAGPDNLMFQRDIRRQSSLCNDSSGYVNVPDTRDTASATLFPNPANSALTINFPNPGNRNHRLTIYNAGGQPIKRVEHITGETVSVETGNWPCGLYYFRLQNDSGFEEKGKFIIAR